jgi:cation:H+ antiporter
LVLYVLFRYEGNARWEPAGELAQPLESAKDMKDAHEQRYASTSTPKIAAFFALSALGVLVFGSLVALSGEGLAEQTGLGQGFVGAVLVALATSLPELSTTWSAIRFGAYSMAIANIVGTNCIEVALILPADLAYRDGAIIDALAPSVSFLAALGIVTTCIYLWGVLERRDRTILGMGVDSALVLVVYVGGIIIYWGLS